MTSQTEKKIMKSKAFRGRLWAAYFSLSTQDFIMTVLTTVVVLYLLFTLQLAYLPKRIGAKALNKFQHTDLGPEIGQFGQFSKNGAWCWFADPRAVYHKGKFTKVECSEERLTCVGKSSGF
jgi:hypothetical protein